MIKTRKHSLRLTTGKCSMVKVLQKVREMSEKQQTILHCLESVSLNAMVCL